MRDKRTIFAVGVVLVDFYKRVALFAVSRAGDVQRSVVFRMRILLSRGVKGNVLAAGYRLVLSISLAFSWLFSCACAG